MSNLQVQYIKQMKKHRSVRIIKTEKNNEQKKVSKKGRREKRFCGQKVIFKKNASILKIENIQIHIILRATTSITRNM